MESSSQGSELLGKSFADVRQKLGAPTAEDQFSLGPVVPEFRVELTNLFDDARRQDDPPDIREATWALSSEENLTVWFAQSNGAEDWNAIHSMSWAPGDQF
ncbi:hypothetical protein [Phaeobacter sp. HF9A]|uniref:hypothetical protein n=1 Tax=Phaeobacter sp. HF9A TaxID=2721561 RepID=UPI0014301136|nr:hypothetical protein [Phaeobacter sp. HF9A]NIZ12344.1 hypothetical protein [Phaeobacter sp. HF9A]